MINKDGSPLMPCKPTKAKNLLRSGKAKVVSTTPFTIKLLWDCEDNTQEIVAGMDAGSVYIGSAAVSNGTVLYQAEVKIRQDVSKKMKKRAMYRRNRRSRKTRYRPERWLNRKNSTKSGRLPPSVMSKIDSHLREKKQMEAILPITHWRVETASFDIHKITTPGVSGKEYQQGEQEGHYNTKAYVLHRDKYKCQSRQKCKHHEVLEVHHINFRSNGGSNKPSNLITLCKTCHDDLHIGKFKISKQVKDAKHATQMGIIKSQLKKLWDFEETFGYQTKFKREKILGLSKSHANDAIAICYNRETIFPKPTKILYKRHVCSGDYQQTKGKMSEIKIPTGKLFGIRKFDLIKTVKGIGFVKGKRSSGQFSICDIHWNKVSDSVNIKNSCVRVSSRSTTLNQY